MALNFGWRRKEGRGNFKKILLILITIKGEDEDGSESGNTSVMIIGNNNVFEVS